MFTRQLGKSDLTVTALGLGCWAIGGPFWRGEPEYIRQACEASLRRLKTDYIDLYQFHIGDFDLEKADAVQETLERLVDAGKIRWYGWSTDDPARAAFFTRGEHYVAVQQRFNIFEGDAETLAICEQHGLASINRSPLAKGLLTGKFDADSTLPENDVRRDWDFRRGEQAQQLRTLEALRAVLTREGHSPAQAALGWLWARSDVTVPIPGFKNVQQVEENVGALARGPLSAEQMADISELLAS